MAVETGTITVKRGLAADLPVWVLKGGVIMPVPARGGETSSPREVLTNDD